MNEITPERIESISNGFMNLKNGFDKVLNEIINLPELLITGIIQATFPGQDIEVKILEDSTKIISKKNLPREQLLVLQSIFPKHILSWNEYMTCIIYTLKIKKEL